MFNDVKLYGSVTVGSKGQIVIPAEAREELKIKEGDKLIILRASHGEGLAIVKGKMLEKLLGKMQSSIGSIVDSIHKTKETN